MFGKSKKILNKKLDDLSDTIKKSNLQEISYLLGNKKQIIIRNFLAGIARGVGIGIGITVITAILVIFLNHLVTLNIPIIGEYISDIVKIVEKKME